MFARTRPILVLLTAMISVQCGATFAKNLFPVLGAVGTVALRVVFAAILLLLIWRPWRLKWAAPDLGRLAIYGLALGLMNLTFYLAIQRLPLGIAVALEFTGPLLMAVIFSRRPIDFLWIVLAAVGIGLLVLRISPVAALDGWGIIYALAAGLFWALYILFGKRAGAAMHGGHAAAMGMAFAALVVLPVALLGSDHRFLIPTFWPLAFAVAVLSSALPYSLEMVALKDLSTTTFSILMSMAPAVAALAGWFFLGERLWLIQAVAIGCIIAASLGTSLGSPPQPEPATPV